MTDALEDHEGTVSVGDRTITNLRFFDDIDSLAGEEHEFSKLIVSRQSLYSKQHRDQCREDHAYDKQLPWHQHRD